MKYEKNKNFRLLTTQNLGFLVDITEKDYGKNKFVLQLNESAKSIWELIDNNTCEDIAESLFNEEDNVFSKEDIVKNVDSILKVLLNKGAIVASSAEVSSEDVVIPQKGFGPFKGAMTMQRQPLIGVVEITPYCNFSCPHCYVKGFKNVKTLTVEQFKIIAETFKEKGILNVTITGGEPFYHPHFKEIYKMFKDEGFLIDIFTNASLIDEEMVEFLAQYPPRSLDITLYGLSDEEYYKFTGINKAFTNVKKALDLLSEHKIFFTTKMILNIYNYERLDEYNAFAYKYNAPFRYNVVVGKGNSTLKSGDEISLPNEKIIEIESQDPVRVNIFKAMASNKINNISFNSDNNDQWSVFPCAAGMDKVFIGYDGRMSPCMTLREKGLNIFEYGYDYIWDYWGKMREQKLSKDFKCATCEYLPICTPCTEEFEQINGDKNIPIEKVCELAKMRMEKYIRS